MCFLVKICTIYVPLRTWAIDNSWFDELRLPQQDTTKRPWHRESMLQKPAPSVFTASSSKFWTGKSRKYNGNLYSAQSRLLPFSLYNGARASLSTPKETTPQEPNK